MSKMLWWAASSVVVLSATTLTGCFATRAGYETAPYQVVRRDGKVEVRSYPAMTFVETPSGGDDFMRLFRYISKENAGEQKIAMTTPVFMTGAGSDAKKMAFVMPEKMETAPAPKDGKVQVRRIEPGTFAVLRFRGDQQGPDGEAYRTLQEWMKAQNLPSTGPATFGYFDPPWTPGFLRRNEVMIPTVVGP